MKEKRLSVDYYWACLERIESARRLYGEGRYVAAIYLSGVAVECLLRAYMMKTHPSFDARHDFSMLLKQSGIAAFIPEGRQREFGEHFDNVWARWKNNYRYVSSAWLRSKYRKLGLNKGVKGCILKANSLIIYESASKLINSGVKRWESGN